MRRGAAAVDIRSNLPAFEHARGAASKPGVGRRGDSVCEMDWRCGFDLKQREGAVLPRVHRLAGVAFKLACGDGESIQWRFDLEGFALPLSGGFLAE